MGDITKHFSRAEFQCRCGCGFGLQDDRVAYVLQRLRDYLNQSLGQAYGGRDIWIDITGPVRCKKRNDATPGASRNSYHMKGIACDFKVRVGKELVLDPKIAFTILDTWYPNEFGIGLYSNRVHLDTRENRARWFTG